MPYAALILAVLGGGLCALLALNTAVAASQVRERNLDAANDALTDREQQLSREVAGLQAPGALARRAAALGLVPADAPAFLRIGPDGQVTVLGSPARVSAQAPDPPLGSTARGTTAVTTPARSTPTQSTARSSGSTARATAARTGATTAAPATRGRPAATSTPAKTPTPTRLPTVTLPGGPR
ncbi:MAG: hypothetical protein ABJA87_11240 [bacterium]